VTGLPAEDALPGTGDEAREGNRSSHGQAVRDPALRNGHRDEGRLPLVDVDDADLHQRFTADSVLGDLARLTVLDLRLRRLGQQDRRGRGLNSDHTHRTSPS
jgi:hypothetical protein